MTRLDTAALHRWLTDQIEICRQTPTYGMTEADTAAALTKVDGWLRRLAGDQLHTPGHDRNPPALLASGRVEADADTLRRLLDQWAAETPIEARAKTFQEVANQLDRFTIAPDPFPFADRQPQARPPLAHRLQLAVDWARSLI